MRVIPQTDGALGLAHPPADDAAHGRRELAVRRDAGKAGFDEGERLIGEKDSRAKSRGVAPFTLDELKVIAYWFSTTPPVLMGYATEPRTRKPVRGSARCAARDSNPEPSD